jgi:hypothetical protein
MKRKKVKLYGLVPVSERTFLFVQGSCLACLLSVFFMILWVPPDTDAIREAADTGEAMPDDDSKSDQPALTPFQAGFLRAFARFVDWAPWLLIALIAIGLLETFSVLRKFRELNRADESGDAAIQ